MPTVYENLMSLYAELQNYAETVEITAERVDELEEEENEEEDEE